MPGKAMTAARTARTALQVIMTERRGRRRQESVNQGARQSRTANTSRNVARARVASVIITVHSQQRCDTGFGAVHAETGQFSPHCLRHSAITFALDAGVSPRDVQDYAGHKDPGLAFASSRR